MREIPDAYPTETDAGIPGTWCVDGGGTPQFVIHLSACPNSIPTLVFVGGECYIRHSVDQVAETVIYKWSGA